MDVSTRCLNSAPDSLPAQENGHMSVSLVIQAVCRAYNMPIEAIQKPNSKRGNLIGTHLSSDARITLGYLLLEAANMPLRDVCHLLRYSYNHRRSYELRRRHKIYHDNDPAYRNRYRAVMMIIAAADRQVLGIACGTPASPSTGAAHQG